MWKLILLNIFLVFLVFVFGMYGAPPGEATTVIFVGISIIGLLSVAISLIMFFSKNGRYRGKWYWLVLLLILGILEMSILNWEVFF